jgi:PAS domain S-box-containing protein
MLVVGAGFYLFLNHVASDVIKEEIASSSLINEIRVAYAITGILLLMASFLFIYYLEKTIQFPLSRMIERLKSGEKPHYKGINEFEFLSDTIGTILDSLQNETRKLNSIYHIALSKRGKEFVEEVALAVAGMFNLNSCISRINPGGETAQALSICLNGELKGEMEIPLKGMPCEGVMTKKQMVVIERGVCQRFPSAQLLAEMGAESYAGIPVFDRKGNVTGIVNVFGKQRNFTDADMKVLRTIGQMVAAEFETLEKTLYLENILHASTDTAIVSSDLDFRITYYNSAAEKIFGYKAEEVIGEKLTKLPIIHGVNPALFREGLELVRSKGEHQFFYAQKKDGEICYIDARIYSMLDELKRPAGFVLMARDITDYKQLEQQLLHSQKLEAVGMLAGGVAHQFNNILMAIMGYGNLLKDKLGEDHPYKTYLENILVSSERAAGLTQGLLAFSRKQILNLRRVNLNEMVRRLEGILGVVVGKNIEVRTRVAKGDLMVIADSGQLEQVMMNLATNARDAMPHGGTLTIETDMIVVDGKNIPIPIETGLGRHAVISFSDTGTGIDEKTRGRIFEPFFTTKEVGKGTGLGLSIAFGIIRQHNGTILVSSEPGKGTTFKIYLPLSDQLPAKET